MKKLIALDIDGTLLNSKNMITEKTKDALIRAQDRGHILVIASGRDPIGVMPYAEDLDFYNHNGLICTFNGGKVINCETNEVLIDHSLEMDLAKDILKFAKENDMTYLIYAKDSIITNSEKTYRIGEISKADHNTYEVIDNLEDLIDFKPNKILFSIDPAEIDEKIEIFDRKYKNKVNAFKSTPFFYEIMPIGIEKGASLVEMSRYLNIDIKDTIAFGDERNDLGMLEAAGVGVVMANAPDIVKEYGDYITKSNDEDGIAYYLDKFLL